MQTCRSKSCKYFTWSYFSLDNSIRILGTVYLFCTGWSFAIHLLLNILFQTFDYFWKHVPAKFLIPLWWWFTKINLLFDNWKKHLLVSHPNVKSNVPICVSYHNVSNLLVSYLLVSHLWASYLWDSYLLVATC